LKRFISQPAFVLMLCTPLKLSVCKVPCMYTWRCGGSPCAQTGLKTSVTRSDQRHRLRPTFAGRSAPTWEGKTVSSLWETSLQANRAGQQASPQANIRQQAGSYRGREVCLDFVGACLQANRAGKQASPQANIRQQAGSYRGREVCLDFVDMMDDLPTSQRWVMLMAEQSLSTQSHNRGGKS
jgi:hypothetical protein